MKKLRFLILLFLATPLVFAQEYQLLVDKHWSPYAGSSITISTYNFYKFIDDKLLPNGEGHSDIPWLFARTGKITLDYILSSFLTVSQHEIFGHGYRAREFGFSDISYEVHISSGATYFLISDYNSLNIYQQNALNAAGMESNTILSQKLRQPWLMQKSIDYRDGLFYFLNQFEQFNYVYITHHSDLDNGNDVNNYISGVNSYYGNNTLSNNKMRTAVLWDLFDPALYYSLYSIGDFLVNGTSKTTQLSMLQIQDYQYLPAGRTIFAPWGLEFQLQNFVLTPENSLYQVNLRYGSNSNISSYGIDVNIKPIWRRDRWNIGNQVSIWVQPSMNFANAALTQQRFGLAEFISFEYRAQKDVGFIGDIGYKTAGFMQGFLLDSSIIFRIGTKW